MSEKIASEIASEIDSKLGPFSADERVIIYDGSKCLVSKLLKISSCSCSIRLALIKRLIYG